MGTKNEKLTNPEAVYYNLKELSILLGIIRKAKGESILGLANKAGLTTATIYRLEGKDNGSALVNMTSLIAYLDALGISLYDIIKKEAKSVLKNDTKGNVVNDELLVLIDILEDEK